ncbi:MAG: HlyC/CorC family transporter [Phycisphaeraceae bacterium]|nr:HlyC/CorC family transporter [Phycisphaeraceae bacterium]
MSALWVLIASTVLAGMLATLHYALADLARASLEEIASVKNRPAATRRVDAILRDVSGHSRAIAVPMILCLAAAVAAAVEETTNLRSGTGMPVTHADEIIGVLAASLILWVLCVSLPMSIAWHAGERLVYAWSPLVRGIYHLGAPLRALGRFLDEMVKRLAGVQGDTRNEVLQAELMSVVEEGEREGQIDLEQREMIEAVVEFRNLTAKQVMTPRTEIEAFEETNELGAVTRIIKEIGHSRIPVYQGSLDNVVGIFYVKDLMRWLAGDGTHAPGKPFSLRAILRPALFVPETKPVRELLRELLKKKVHIAMVADEFGGTAGLVTIEDMVEEIVGDIRDEYEPTEPEKPDVEVKLHERTAEVDARAYIDDVNDALLPLGWSLPEGDDYDTVGGFVITTLGRIPEQGESFRHDRATVTVLEASPTRVLKVRLEVGQDDDDHHHDEDDEPASRNGGPVPQRPGDRPAEPRTQ